MPEEEEVRFFTENTYSSIWFVLKKTKSIYFWLRVLHLVFYIFFYIYIYCRSDPGVAMEVVVCCYPICPTTNSINNIIRQEQDHRMDLQISGMLVPAQRQSGFTNFWQNNKWTPNNWQVYRFFPPAGYSFVGYPYHIQAIKLNTPYLNL